MPPDLDARDPGLYTAGMTRNGEDRSGGSPTGGGAAARDARLRAALRQNLARRKARVHALARPAALPHDDDAAAVAGGPSGPSSVEGAPADLPTDPAPADPAKDS